MTRSADPYDELAAMFLTPEERADADVDHDADDDGHDGSGRTENAKLEILVVGHLPVRAGLWLAPYADAVARDAGTTALVRLDGDDPMVQLLTPRTGDTPSAAACRSLRESILELGPAVHRWIVRPSTRTTMADIVRAGAQSVTILSSADQAALVNAYRIVKDLAEASEKHAPDIGVAVIGSAEPAARTMVERLNQTTLECLDLSVTMTRCLPRMDAGFRSSWLRSFPGQLRPTLSEVIGWVGQAAHAAPTSASAPAPASVPASASVPAPAPASVPASASASVPASASAPAPAPADPIEISADVRKILFSTPIRATTLPPAEPPAAAPPAPVKLAPKTKAKSEWEPKAADHKPPEPTQDGGPVALATHVTGLHPIAPRCPGHERVELALDAKGRIHLLGRADTMREMPVVETWAHAHRELLDLACPHHEIDPRGVIVCHLFSAAPLEVADLHASRLHLHVLAPVDVGGKRGWYAAPLNDPTLPV